MERLKRFPPSRSKGVIVWERVKVSECLTRDCLGFYGVSTVFRYLTATVHKSMFPRLCLTNT